MAMDNNTLDVDLLREIKVLAAPLEMRQNDLKCDIGFINTISQGALGNAFKNRGHKFRQPTWHL